VRELLLAGTVVVLVSACGGSPPPTDEDLALRACSAELRQRLSIPEDDSTSQTQMIGRRDYGFLVRGLTSAAAPTGPQNYECRLDTGTGRPTLTYLRLCRAGESPWGCPANAG
jgi:hypothetical protein